MVILCILSDSSSFDKMVEEVRGLKTGKLLDISRSFANFLALANAAENHHRVRRLKESILSSGSNRGLWPKEDSCGGSIKRLASEGVPAKDIVEALKTQCVEIVLTAHPTEVNRRTMLRKFSRIQQILATLDGKDLTNFEKKSLNDEMAGVVTSIWDSDDLRRKKPTPVDGTFLSMMVPCVIYFKKPVSIQRQKQVWQW